MCQRPPIGPHEALCARAPVVADPSPCPLPGGNASAPHSCGLLFGCRVLPVGFTPPPPALERSPPPPPPHRGPVWGWSPGPGIAGHVARLGDHCTAAVRHGPRSTGDAVVEYRRRSPPPPPPPHLSRARSAGTFSGRMNEGWPYDHESDCERAVHWHEGQKAMTTVGQARPEPNADTAP